MGITLPVLRRLIIPDPGFTLLDLDLSAADVQVVAWESGDEVMKDLLRRRMDIYTETETGIWSDPRLPASRTLRKSSSHSANYGAGYKTVADKYIGNRAAAKHFLETWFRFHPKIRSWQQKIEFQLQQTREVRNVWGFRRFYTDRMGPDILHQALAWIGQSTVSITINKILLRIDEAQREGLPCFILLQVHDNLVCQIPSADLSSVLPVVMELTRIPIPFSDPLIIPASFKISDRSWADVRALPGALPETSPIGSARTAA